MQGQKGNDMGAVLVAIHSTLTGTGGKDVDLLIYSHNVGNPSPCAVFKNGFYEGSIGGSIDHLDQILQLELNKHPGYSIKERTSIIALTNPAPDKSESFAYVG